MKKLLIATALIASTQASAREFFDEPFYVIGAISSYACDYRYDELKKTFSEASGMTEKEMLKSLNTAMQDSMYTYRVKDVEFVKKNRTDFQALKYCADITNGVDSILEQVKEKFLGVEKEMFMLQ